jgi:transketolase
MEESTRDGFGKGLLDLGANENVVVLSADLSESTRAKPFKDSYPERYIECGVAEQNMAGIAAGLALSGKIPFATSFAVFSPGRNWEQIRVSICYNKANVKIASTHAGLSTGADGATHQALEDIAIMRCLPNMAVVVPCDAVEARKATSAVANLKGPCYLRLGRDKCTTITDDKTHFKIGKADVLRQGKDVTVIACGIMVVEALKAATELKGKISVRVINCHTIKPLDKSTILKAAKETKAVVTAEEHQISGGLGSAVAELLSQSSCVPIRMVGVKDTFGESGTPKELLEKYGLTYKYIVKAIHEAVKSKC